VSDESVPPEHGADRSTGATDGVFDAVRDGYDAVYSALTTSNTFNRLWRERAYGGDFPAEFEHIGFLTLPEAQHLAELLAIAPGELIIDLACGAGGPGLWLAKETGAHLIGIDPSAAGIAAARERAARTGLNDVARFEQGNFQRTGQPDRCAGAVISIEAFQYAPDKRAALIECARILKPGGRLGIVCFEVDPATAAGLPVLGVDPVSDYRSLLTDTGFDVDTYEETPGWQSRVNGAFTSVLDAHDILVAEMGQHAADSAAAEAAVTVQLQPYPRRVLIVARRREHKRVAAPAPTSSR
jgi:SAM-dependent methyltransferase